MAWLIPILGALASVLFSSWTNGDYYRGVVHGHMQAAIVFVGLYVVSKIQLQFWQLVLAGVGVWVAYNNVPHITLPVLPIPQTTPDKRKPLLPWRRDAVESFHEGERGPGGEEPVCDLPTEYRMKNVGGRDGAGLCVFTSINHSAFWQQVEALQKFQKQMRAEPGGGYPEKVDAMIAKYAKGVEYVQHTGGDEEFLTLALKTQRMPGVTYAGRDTRYNGPIAHMVNLIYLDDKAACILDNNFPDKPLWMTRKEFLDRWRDRGGGWAVVLLNSPPPPPPTN